MSSLLLGTRMALPSASSPLQLQWRRRQQQQQRRPEPRGGREAQEAEGAAQQGYGSMEDGNREVAAVGGGENARDNNNDDDNDNNDDDDDDNGRISSLVSRLHWIFVLLVLPMVPLFVGVAYFGTGMMWWTARLTLWKDEEDNEADSACRTVAAPLVTYAMVSLIVTVYSAYHLLHMIQPTNQASAAAAAATLGGIWRLPENSVRLNDYLVFQIYYLYLSIGADIVDTTTKTTTAGEGREDNGSGNSGGTTLCWDRSRSESSGGPPANTRSMYYPTAYGTSPETHPYLKDTKNHNSTTVTIFGNNDTTSSQTDAALPGTTLCDSTCPQDSPSHALFVAMRNYVNTLRPFSVTACVCMVLLMPLVYYRMVQAIRHRHQQQQHRRRRHSHGGEAHRRRQARRRRRQQRRSRRRRRRILRHGFWTLGGDAGLHDDDDDDDDNDDDDEWTDPNTVNAVLNRMDQVEFRNISAIMEGGERQSAADDMVKEVVTVAGQRRREDYGNDNDNEDEGEDEADDDVEKAMQVPQFHDKDEVPTCCICLVEFDFTEEKAALSRSNSGSSDNQSMSLFGEEFVPLMSSSLEETQARRPADREENVILIEEEIDVVEEEEGPMTIVPAPIHGQGELHSSNHSAGEDVAAGNQRTLDLEAGHNSLEEEMPSSSTPHRRRPSSRSSSGSSSDNDNHSNNNSNDFDDVAVRTECGHYFHRACIETWISGTTSRFWDSSSSPAANRRRRRFRPPRRTACPLCKTDLSGGTAAGMTRRGSAPGRTPQFDPEERIRQEEFLPRLPLPLRWFFRGLFVAWLFWWRGFGFSSD